MSWKDFIDGEPRNVAWTGISPKLARRSTEDLLKDIPVPDSPYVAAKLLRGAAMVIWRIVLWCLDRDQKDGCHEQLTGWTRDEPWTAEELFEEGASIRWPTQP